MYRFLGSVLGALVVSALLGTPQDSTDIVVIPPGAGFRAATDLPSAIGEGPGSDARVIARWDVVPDQVFEGDFEIGVIAFHYNGIDRVELSAEGGPWTPIAHMTENSRTNVWEYTGLLRAGDFGEDGSVEIRAIAYPLAGKPRLLEPLHLFCNAGGSLAGMEVFVASDGDVHSGLGTRERPYSSIRKGIASVGDGGTVTILKPGTYSVEGQAQVLDNARWITVRADSGLDWEQVVIAQDGVAIQPRVRRLRWVGVAFDFGRTPQYYPDDGQQAWFDACRFFDSFGRERDMPVPPVRRAGFTCVTNCLAQDMELGFVHLDLVRGCRIERLSGDALTGSDLVINTSLENVVGNLIPGNHTDFIQHFFHVENKIVYGVTGWNMQTIQSLMLGGEQQTTVTDCAFVNVAAVNVAPTDPPFSQFGSTHSHVLFQHVSVVGQRTIFRDDFVGGKQYKAHNVRFDNCVFDRLIAGEATLPAGVEVHSSHFGVAPLHGTDPTTGPIEIVPRGDGFAYSGAGARRLRSNGIEIPGMNHPGARDRLGRPNRGAFPATKFN